MLYGARVAAVWRSSPAKAAHHAPSILRWVPVRRLRPLLARLALLTMVGAMAAVAGAAPVAAHSGSQSYVYLEVFQTEIAGRVEFPVRDINEVLDLDIPQEEAAAIPLVEEHLALLQAYADEHLTLGAEGEVWPLEFDGFSFLEVGGPNSYVVLHFTVAREFTETPRTFAADYDGIIHQKSERDALLLIATDWGSGTFNNESAELVRFTPGNTTQLVELGGRSFWRGLAGVIGLGVDHIRIGTDHILFILALVLPAVLVYSRRDGWRGAPGFGSSLWRVLKIVTMFTVAHTITLLLGGLGLVELPPALVETVIALSIAAAALHNIRPLFINNEWLLAFGFGLFHGFGFAGLLSDLGLTQDRRFLSLLGFNLGIELGQAVIVLLVFPSLYLLRRTAYYVRAMYAASIALAAVATAWAVERMLGVDLNVTALVDRVVMWPRSLAIVALLTAGSVALLLVERRAGRLVAVAGDGPGDAARS